jgi:hypothetical protein
LSQYLKEVYQRAPSLLYGLLSLNFTDDKCVGLEWPRVHYSALTFVTRFRHIQRCITPLKCKKAN